MVQSSLLHTDANGTSLRVAVVAGENGPRPDVLSITAHAVGVTPVEVVAANPQRISALIQNAGTIPVFIGTTAAVTTASGFRLGPNEVLSELFYRGAIWAVASGANGDVRVLQEVD